MARPQFQWNVDVGVFTAEDYIVEGASPTSGVLAGESETVTLTPPAGYICTLRALHIEVPVPAGAASGTHYVEAYTSGGGFSVWFAVGTYSYNQAIQFKAGYWRGTLASALPADEAAMLAQFQNARWDSDNPLILRYYNGTDVSQVGARKYWVGYTRKRVA